MRVNQPQPQAQEDFLLLLNRNNRALLLNSQEEKQLVLEKTKNLPVGAA
jgi:hypothetical protein